MKKFLCMLLAVMMLLALSVSALADEAPATDGTENQANVLAGSAAPASKEEFDAYVEYLREFMTAYDGVGDGTFDDGARDMALGELDTVAFGDDVNAFPFEMYVSVFGADDYATFAGGSKKDGGMPAAEGLSAEEAYVEYIHEWLLAELEVNGSMTIDQVEDEFMPLVEAGDYESFPADMLFSGMLESGVAMTFEEFAAQYVPAAPAAGGTDEAAYRAYLCAFVDSCEDIRTSGNTQEFKDAINAGNYVDFPVEMLFNEQWFGEAAMTYEEFVAAGGVYSIGEHASNGAMLDGTGEG